MVSPLGEPCAPRLVEHALAGPIWVVSSSCSDPGTEARVLGAAVGVTLLDAAGAPIEDAAATIAPPLAPTSLREIDTDSAIVVRPTTSKYVHAPSPSACTSSAIDTKRHASRVRGSSVRCAASPANQAAMARRQPALASSSMVGASNSVGAACASAKKMAPVRTSWSRGWRSWPLRRSRRGGGKLNRCHAGQGQA
ncbi:MAG: hypothetical protein U5K74_16480 [Gemmatimonadaceae bacterium]|nr:hypothetical protein [Gemmatimonadaceae bacterium]